MFDNATSYSIYAKDELQVVYMNEGLESQQLFICSGWYMADNGEIVSPEISIVVVNPSTGQSSVVQKKIQVVLVEQEL